MPQSSNSSKPIKHLQSDSAIGSCHDLTTLSTNRPGGGTKGASKKPALPPSQYDNYFLDAKKQFRNKLVMEQQPTVDLVVNKPTTKLLVDILKRTHHSQYTDSLVKRHKALRKRIDRIEKYEHNDISILNKDQKDSLTQLPYLRGAIKEVEDSIMQFTDYEDENKSLIQSKDLMIDSLSTKTQQLTDQLTDHTTVFQMYTKLIKELMDLDQDDVTVAQLRDLFTNQEIGNVFALTQRVLNKDPDQIDGVDGVVTFENVYTRLIESPLRIEDLLTPPEFMAVNTSEEIPEQDSVEQNTTSSDDTAKYHDQQLETGFQHTDNQESSAMIPSFMVHHDSPSEEEHEPVVVNNQETLDHNDTVQHSSIEKPKRRPRRPRHPKSTEQLLDGHDKPRPPRPNPKSNNHHPASSHAGVTDNQQTRPQRSNPNFRAHCDDDQQQRGTRRPPRFSNATKINTEPTTPQDACQQNPHEQGRPHKPHRVDEPSRSSRYGRGSGQQATNKRPPRPPRATDAANKLGSDRLANPANASQTGNHDSSPVAAAS